MLCKLSFNKQKFSNITYLVIMALKVTPVPIPNTMVKLQGADGTAGVALWKSKLSPGYMAS